MHAEKGGDIEEVKRFRGENFIERLPRDEGHGEVRAARYDGETRGGDKAPSIGKGEAQEPGDRWPSEFGELVGGR